MPVLWSLFRFRKRAGAETDADSHAHASLTACSQEKSGEQDRAREKDLSTFVVLARP